MVDKHGRLKTIPTSKLDDILLDITKKEKFSKEGKLTKKIDSFSSLDNAKNSDVSFYSSNLLLVFMSIPTLYLNYIGTL